MDAAHTGGAELAAPTCPASSQIGTVVAGAGAGTHQLYVNGRAFLAGPYKGAPLSMVFVTPAVSGPYDLGNVVVRAAVNVDPVTAQASIASDPAAADPRRYSAAAAHDPGQPRTGPASPSTRPIAIRLRSAATLLGNEGASVQPADRLPGRQLRRASPTSRSLSAQAERRRQPSRAPGDPRGAADEGRRSEHQQRRGHPSQGRAGRHRPPEHRLHPGPVRRRLLPGRFADRGSEGHDAAPRPTRSAATSTCGLPATNSPTWWSSSEGRSTSSSPAASTPPRAGRCGRTSKAFPTLPSRRSN